ADHARFPSRRAASDGEDHHSATAAPHARSAAIASTLHASFNAVLFANHVPLHRSDFGFITLCGFGQYLVDLALFLLAEVGLAFTHRTVLLLKLTTCKRCA